MIKTNNWVTESGFHWYKYMIIFGLKIRNYGGGGQAFGPKSMKFQSEFHVWTTVRFYRWQYEEWIIPKANIFDVPNLIIEFFVLKVFFFQKVLFVFQISQSPRKKYSTKLSWTWNSKFKFRIVFWNIFLWRMGDLKNE